MPATLRLGASVCALTLAAALLPGAAAHAAATNGPTIRVSVATDGSQGTLTGSREPSLSADGRFVVFSSGDKLAASDTNPLDDVYLRDVRTGITELISVRASTVVTGIDSAAPAVSADGRFVVFVTNGDLNGGPDTFGGTYLRDRQAGTTTRIGGRDSWDSAGPDITPDGNYVVFHSFFEEATGDLNWSTDVHLWERRTGAVSTVSARADGSTTVGESSSPTISDDGRYVAYMTTSPELSGSLTGRAFVVTDRTNRATTVVTDETGLSGTPKISGDGNFVAFARNASSRTTDVYSWERSNGRIVPVSVNVNGNASSGISLTASISRSGRFIAFWSSARDLIADEVTAPMSVFRWDRNTGRSILAMTPPDDAFYGSETGEISDDGYYLAAETKSATMVPGDTNGEFDVFRVEVSTPKRNGPLITPGFGR